MTSRQQQAQETKRHIKEAAYALLSQSSYSDIKMNQIASAAGVSVGTLYHHFSSKEELFFSGYHNFDNMVSAFLNEITFDSSVEAIRAMIYAQTSGAGLRGSNLMACILIIQLSTHGNLYYSMDRAFPQYIRTHVHRAIARGELCRVDDEESLVYAILRSARGVIYDQAVRDSTDALGTLALKDLDILLTHYAADQSAPFPPVNPIWLDTYKQWLQAEHAENA